MLYYENNNFQDFGYQYYQPCDYSEFTDFCQSYWSNCKKDHITCTGPKSDFVSFFSGPVPVQQSLEPQPYDIIENVTSEEGGNTQENAIIRGKCYWLFKAHVEHAHVTKQEKQIWSRICN